MPSNAFARLALLAWAMFALAGQASAQDEDEAPAQEASEAPASETRRRATYQVPAARRQATPRAAPEAGGGEALGPGPSYQPTYQQPTYQQPAYQQPSSQGPSTLGGGDDSESGARPLPMPDLSPTPAPKAKKKRGLAPMKSKKRRSGGPDDVTGDPYLDGLAPPRENPLEGLPPAPDIPEKAGGAYKGMLSQYDSVRARLATMSTAAAPGAAPRPEPRSGGQTPSIPVADPSAPAPASNQPTVWSPKTIAEKDQSAPIRSPAVQEPEEQPEPRDPTWWDKLRALLARPRRAAP